MLDRDMLASKVLVGEVCSVLLDALRDNFGDPGAPGDTLQETLGLRAGISLIP